MLLSTCEHFKKQQEGSNVGNNASANGNNQIQSKDAEEEKSQDNSNEDSNQVDADLNKMDNKMNASQDADEIKPEQQNSVHGHLLRCYSTTCRKETNPSCYSTECRQKKQNNERNVGIATQGNIIDLMNSKDAEEEKPQQCNGHVRYDKVDIETNIKDANTNAYHEHDQINPEKQNSVCGPLHQCYSTICRKELSPYCYSTECRNKKQNSLQNITRAEQEATMDQVQLKGADEEKSHDNSSRLDSKEADTEINLKEDNINTYNDKCFLCLKVSEYNCASCSVPYCSQAHYNLHSFQNPQSSSDSSESTYCFPFRVLEREEVGRYVVATRDIAPLELILVDHPAAFGPNHDTSPACLECLLPIDAKSIHPCEMCNLPLCSPTTSCGKRRSSGDSIHARAECNVFSKPTPTGFEFRVKLDREIPDGKDSFIAPEYGCITPLRLLMLKDTEPHTWDRLQLLMDHDEDRRKETRYQEMFQINVVDFLRKTCGFDYTEEEIFRVIGILRTNAFHIQDPIMKRYNVGGRAIFPTFSFLSHSCISNARYSIEPISHKITLRSQVPIRKGDEITVQYMSFMFGQCRRKKEIPSFWFFDCRCVRCMDPTECGSLVSAMLCPKCTSKAKQTDEGKGNPDIGYLLPDDPLNVINGTWSCRKCNFKQDGKVVDDICDNAADELANTYENDINRYTEILEKLSTMLHPSHYIMMTLKKYIADLLGTSDGYRLHQLSDDQLDLKIRYSEDFLRVIGLVDPGQTKWRGTLLFDLHTALYWKSNKKYAMSHTNKTNNSVNQVNNEINHENQTSLSGQSLQCYSTMCRKDNNPSCYSTECRNKRKNNELKVIQDAPTAKAVFLEELRNIEAILKESMKCLEHEAENTVEGVTYKMAKKALTDIGEIMFFSEFI